ncbi:Uncharacterised protein [Chlamydia trachomatis]|jgi:hypothetical protein|uniref:Uncharacterized protein n=1 Tax=Candidatus Nanogingivalis gingivitcus TaxID=2171992 RepID=A0ABY0FI78_9BACT|nr:hypothetical protein G6CMJM_00427 [Candidatus Nanogingivalis gingivitcus]CRH94359.1 Uncharacterised protein [Chlamydia trachomatis]
MISKIYLVLSLIALCGIIAIVNLFTPTDIGPLGILGFFVLVYIMSVGMVNLFLYGVYRLIYMLKSNIFQSKERKTNNHNISYFLKYSLVISFTPLVLIARQSSGGINLLDIFLLLIIEIIALVYVSKR